MTNPLEVSVTVYIPITAPKTFRSLKTFGKTDLY